MSQRLANCPFADFEHMNAKRFKSYAGQNNCFFAGEISPASDMCCFSVSFYLRTRYAKAFLLILGLSLTQILRLYCDETYEQCFVFL